MLGKKYSSAATTQHCLCLSKSPVQHDSDCDRRTLCIPTWMCISKYSLEGWCDVDRRKSFWTDWDNISFVECDWYRRLVGQYSRFLAAHNHILMCFVFSAMTMAIPVAKRVRDVFYKHRASGMIEHNAVFVGMIVAELPYLLLMSVLFVLIYCATVSSLFATLPSSYLSPPQR